MSFAFDFDELGIRQRKKCSSKSLYIAEELFGGILKGVTPLKAVEGVSKGWSFNLPLLRSLVRFFRKK
ncbi:MAG TPA: hypothetical protein IAD32_05580 [Candidatus Scatavimonas merdigallinarum]|uniref:Uncharacterized protein n=1 Tax=Candidatus Scatavimonas merdigallinarum TaxID=2840914 RepID=A0A9D0ZHK2_9FIRM|nr:hypothetical protein [Candidatus Scatavimonas merdigallinarum]